jgi:23S rRNA (uracil1939-C5)-methyltransferase
MEARQILKISSLSSAGEGIGSIDGMKIFVEGALPGEEVAVTLVEQKKSYAKAELNQILSPSLERTKPPCSAFGQCGGCQVMHLHYPSQLEFKRKRVFEALERIGGMYNPEVLPCLPSPFSLGYRNKIQIPVLWEKGKKILGLYRKNSHEIIPLDRCLIQCPQGEAIFHLIAEKLCLPTVRYVLIRNALFREEALVLFVTSGQFSKELKKLAEELMASHSLIKGVVENVNRRKGNTILGPTFRLLAGRPYIYETLLNRTFKISPSAFFQINPAQTERLYEKAIELAEIDSQENVLDAYCGVGALAIFAAAHTKKVHGIECVSQAIADAIENARLNNVGFCRFTCGKAEEKIQEEEFDTLFLNPPRKGCDPKLIKSLLEKKPKKIVYISCDPATLARDLALLSNKYKPNAIQPMDMFPQTMHVETVVRLTREGG